MKTFDPTKPVQTRDGRPARILATDLKGNRPIIAAVMETRADDEAYEATARYSLAGHLINDAYEARMDLVNVAVKRTKLVYLYESDKGYDVVSLAPPELRRRFVNADPIASKLVEFVEGEFE